MLNGVLSFETNSVIELFFIQVVGTVFTHHQKCVIVDTQAAGNNRKITAFIGGLDLCDGRYDTPEHRLFRNLDDVFDGLVTGNLHIKWMSNNL